jgi:hypothetical protein
MGKFMIWIGSLNMHEHNEPKGTIAKIQWKIVRFIETPKVQYMLILLMIIDIGLLFLDLTFEAIFGHHPPKWLIVFENINYYSTLTVLMIFEIELLLLFVGYGVKIFFHPMYVIDWIFVTFALVLEIIVKDALVVLIPSFLRMWRILRVAQTVALAQEEYHHRIKEDLEKQLDELENENRELKLQINESPHKKSTVINE